MSGVDPGDPPVLIIFTGFLAGMVFRPTAPWCDCVGVVRLAGDARVHNQLSLARNLLLLLLNVALLVVPEGNKKIGHSENGE